MSARPTGKMLLAQLGLVLSLCRLRSGLLLLPCFPNLDCFGGKIHTVHRLFDWILSAWICQPVQFSHYAGSTTLGHSCQHRTHFGGRKHVWNCNLPFGMSEILSGKVTAGAGALPRTVRDGVTSPSVMTIN
jgi:hypothetical protein